MFLKLVKYEFKALGIRFLQLAGVVFAMTLLASIIVIFDKEAFLNPRETVVSAVVTSAVTTWVVVLIAAVVFSFVLIVKRFYTTIVGKEAYLSYTLPVSSGALVGAKLLVSSLLYIALTLFVMACAVMFFFSVISGSMAGFKDFMGEFNDLVQSLRDENPELLAEYNKFIWINIIGMIVGTFAGNLTWFLSAAIGMQARKYKVGIMLLTMLGITTVLQIITSIVLIPDSMTLIKLDEIHDNKMVMQNLIEFINTVSLKSLIVMIVIGIGSFIGTVLLIDRRPNVTA